MLVLPEDRSEKRSLSATHVHEAAMIGAHVATCPLSVLLQLAKHPLTDAGLAKFLADWEKVPQ